MTDQERDLQRVQAWDAYQSTRTTFLACRKKLQDWATPLINLGNRLKHQLGNVGDLDVQSIPNQQLFINAVHEYQTARTNFERARAEASRFNWPIDTADAE